MMEMKDEMELRKAKPDESSKLDKMELDLVSGGSPTNCPVCGTAPRPHCYELGHLPRPNIDATPVQAPAQPWVCPVCGQSHPHQCVKLSI